jgi:selenocysteine-specific elongation factor
LVVRHYVIGTAGHIDHGKSALVKALTGTDPDRLAEEQRRGMTIDLGFAHFDLPGGRRVGIVDVPGHERLIRNMLAGATGIDLVLFVVAADEGVMPQTREHLDILRFLPVRSGIIVVNKIDILPDAERLALIRDDLRTLAAGTFLDGAPIVEVSAKTGQGLDTLRAAIDHALQDLPGRAADAPVRLPIDRAFTMAGFGTVVTGTLWSGRITSGENLELLPQGRLLRVRGIQSHGAQREYAEAGSRVAVNLAAIDKGEVERGNVLTTPGVFVPTIRLQARVRLLPQAARLSRGTRIRLYLGSAEVFGRLTFPDHAILEPGQESAALLRLEQPLVTDAGDPFVLRRYSPMVTIGGGVVLDAHPPLHRRVSLAVTSNVASEHAAGDAAGIDLGTRDLSARVSSAVGDAAGEGITVDELMRAVAATRPQVEEVVRTLLSSGRLIEARGRLFHVEAVDALADRIRAEIAAYHAAESWRAGIPREELKRRAFGSGDDRLYALALERLAANEAIDDLGGLVRSRGFVPSIDREDAILRDRISAALRAGRFAPPSRDEVAKGAEPKRFERAWRALLDDGTIVDAGQGVYFDRETVEEIKRAVVEEVRAHGGVTVAGLRTKLGTSRKYALTVLEYFDSIKFTRRRGDVRAIVDPSIVVSQQPPDPKQESS